MPPAPQEVVVVRDATPYDMYYDVFVSTVTWSTDYVPQG